ncbi:type II toxin-antitoxin system Phd/YefM family antitoxin [Anatilimnocola sp. NA78]|uniref:type II toxin-antitoxin system Phd/YefM family antitoxin n=1 Tax=Anatilimnocola sp. NA78 TaxID=3415683 RepID=UPI003CE53169
MTTITLAEAQANLSDVIQQLRPGEEIVITDNGLPLVHMKKAPRTSWPAQPGTAKDSILWISPDFDAPLEDFCE